MTSKGLKGSRCKCRNHLQLCAASVPMKHESVRPAKYRPDPDVDGVEVTSVEGSQH